MTTKDPGKHGGPANGPSSNLIEQIKRYRAAHPGSPAGVRRPQLFMRGKLWIATLGSDAEEGVVGIGPTVEEALREFDSQYLTRLHPKSRRQAETMKKPVEGKVQRMAAEAALQADRLHKRAARTHAKGELLHNKAKSIHKEVARIRRANRPG